MTEVFYDLLKASFHGSIVILAVLLLRQLLKKAPRSVFCLLWLLAGLRLVLPFEIESNLSLQPQIPESELSIQAEQPVQVPDVLIQNPDGQPLEVPDMPSQTPSLPEGSGDDMQTENLLYGEQAGIITEPISYGDIAAQVWLLGMAVILAVSAVSYWKLKRRVRMAYLTQNGCFECPGLDTAFVLGFLPPKIYLPAGLTDGEKKFIFDHENTHIARHDHWYKLLGYLVLSLHWFNPLVWVGYGALCRDIELACDEHVVRNMSLTERKAYSAALLSCGGHTAGLTACPVAFGESNPKKRILNVLNYKRPTFWISLTAVIAVIFVAVCLLTSPAQEAEQPDEANDWNLEMTVSDVTPSGLQVQFRQTGIFPGSDRANLQYGSYYTLETWADGAWKEVEMLPQEHEVAWTMVAYLIDLNSTKAFNVDWEWLYGELPAGRYRIGKDVDLYYRIDGETEHQMFYAEFVIEETQSAWNMGMTEEEFLALCRNAVEELQSREQFHISETIAYFTGETEDSRNYAAYWRDGENWLRESYISAMRTNAEFLYYDGNLYLRRKEDSAEATWNRIDGGGAGYGDPWLCQLQWDSQTITFEGVAIEGDELRISMIVHATPHTLGWDDVLEYQVLFLFDSMGNLTRASMSAEHNYTRVMSDLTIENTLADNIRSKLEIVAAQRPGAPELHQTLTEEQWLEKCRTALENYQTQGSWVILVDNQSRGDAVLTENSSQLWYIHGEDWARQGIISNSDFLQENWYLKKDGHCYSRDSVTIHDPANGDGFVNGWQDFEDISDWSLPWPLEFDWENEKITDMEARTDGEGAMIHLNIEGSPNSAKNVEQYLVTLWLRPSGELWQAQLEYTETELTGEETKVCTTISLNAAAPEEAARMIGQCHSEALLHIHGICNDPECTNESHDHSGISCTDEQCTNSTHHHDDHHH